MNCDKLFKNDWMDKKLPPLNKENLSKVADAKLKEKISKEALEKDQIQTIVWLTAEFERSKKMVQEIQPILIDLVMGRLKELQNCIEASIEKSGYSSKKLTALSQSIKDIPSKSLESFLKWFEELDEKVRKVVVKVLGNEKEDQKGVLNFLKEWNNIDQKAKALEGKIRKMTFDSINLIGISNIVHEWNECISHEWKERIPFDQVSSKDVRESFTREGYGLLPELIEVNGDKMPTDFKSEEDFFIQLFSLLYRHCGFNVPTKMEVLKDQIKCVLELDGYKNVPLSPEIKHCYQLLQLASVNSRMRADYYFRSLFEDLLPSKQCLGISMDNKKTLADLIEVREKKHEEKIFFQIDSTNPKKFFVERVEPYSICQNNSEVASFSLSWKVSTPINDKWQCSLRPIKIAFSENITSALARHIVKSFENYKLQIERLDPNIIEIAHNKVQT